MIADLMGSYHLQQLDGCDKCGKPAMFEVMFAGGRTLRFCGHHWHSPEVCALGYQHIKDL